MNRMLGSGAVFWLNIILVLLTVSLNVSFIDVFNVQKIDTDLIIKGILISIVIFFIIVLNIYFTRGMSRNQKILFITSSNGLPPILYSSMTRSVSGIIISVCYVLSIIWILMESKKGGKSTFWNVIMFGWNSQNKITNLLALGVFLAALYSVSTNPQPYIQAFENASLNTVQVDIKNAFNNETLEMFLPKIMSKQEIEEQILAYNCGNDTTCRAILQNTSEFQKAVEETYNKQIEMRNLAKQKMVEQLKTQNHRMREMMRYMLTQIPITRAIIENMHWLVALTSSAIVILYGKIILGPVFVLLSICSYRLIAKKDSWEELVEFIQMRFG